MDWKEILIQQKDWTESSKQSMRLSKEEAIILYRDAPLHDLMSAGLFRRQQMHPNGQVTYLVDRNVNYTNVCTINCLFCSFYRPPGHEENYTQT